MQAPSCGPAGLNAEEEMAFEFLREGLHLKHGDKLEAILIACLTKILKNPYKWMSSSFMLLQHQQDFWRLT
jgi:hypothetical protein